MSRNDKLSDNIFHRKRRFNGIPKWLKSSTEVQVEDEMYKVNEVWKNINTSRIEKKAEFFSTVKESAELRWKSRLERAREKNQYDKVFKILEGYSKGALDVRKGIDTLEKSHEKLQKALKNSEKTFNVRRMIFNLIRRLLGKMTTEERLKELSSDIDQKITAMERLRSYFDGYKAYLGEVTPHFFLISSHNEDPSISVAKGRKKRMNDLFSEVFSKTGEVNEEELDAVLKCNDTTKEKVNSMKKEWEEVLKKTKARKQASGKKKKHTDHEKQLKKEAKQFVKMLPVENKEKQIQTELAQLNEDYAVLQERYEEVLVSGRTVRALAAWIVFKLEYIRITLKSEKDAVAFTELLEEGIELRKKQQEVEKQKEATCKELDDLLKVQPCITHRKKLLKKAKTIVQRKKNTKSPGRRVLSTFTKVGTVASRFHVGSCWEAPQCEANPNSLTKDDADHIGSISEGSLLTTSLSTPSGKAPKRELKRKGLFSRLIPRRRKNKARKKHF